MIALSIIAGFRSRLALFMAGSFILAMAAVSPAVADPIPRSAGLVSAAWVKQAIDYHKPDSRVPAPPEYPYGRDHKLIIFETQWGRLSEARAYNYGHLPGAIHSNTDTYEDLRTRWFLLPDDELKKAAGGMGVTPEATVVVYSDSPIFAARLWWILKYLGVTDARIMDGGFSAWLANGYERQTTPNYPSPTTYRGTINHSVRATTGHVESVYKSPKAQIVDVRSEAEWLGLTSGYDNLHTRGRIPCSVWAFNADPSARIYSHADGSLRRAWEIKEMWRKLGIIFDREVIFHCGGGYRSSLAYFYAYIIGYKNIRNYSDGWEGWSVSYIEKPSGAWAQSISGRPVASGR